MRNVIAVVVFLWQLNFIAEAGEPKLSLADTVSVKSEGGMEFAKLSKLSLAGASFSKLALVQVQPKFEPIQLNITVPVSTNTPAGPLLGEQAGFLLQPPVKKYFPNLHYAHRDWRVGNGTEGEDSFGRLWISKSSPRREFVIPYFRWDYPSRHDQRILLGFMWSRRL
ncbi:MAG: hypothetical protein UX89_C0025G0012 [Parcubacteria group bacterium GW2011_GWA2_47_16]|nr:MAG: hypothetical protein UX89_C0025G0012 [Parcubacteria group bacterium GW2011_GWA2_47_16]